MSIRRLPADATTREVENVLHDMSDGTTYTVAVEIFDHPTVHFSERDDTTVGPWVIGPADEVYEWLRTHNHEEYSEQYATGQEVEE